MMLFQLAGVLKYRMKSEDDMNELERIWKKAVISSFYPDIRLKKLRKKPFFRITGNLAEILTWYISNTSPGRYCSMVHVNNMLMNSVLKTPVPAQLPL
jgi:hypothetical protein